ncbi:cytochrome o ubiquinol oxidase subunit IV [bacterium]|nr:cytochrome o ubiquinol oxidase subunit IV [bacterium]
MTHHSLLGLCTGYGASLVLTALAFATVVLGADGPTAVLVTKVCILAAAQLVVQARYFLHLGFSERGDWNTAVFAYTFLMVLVVGVGSLWIMNNLAYNMMTPQETDSYMLKR